MDRQNYFEVLGLKFDPPESSQRNIDNAIKAWKKRLEDSLAVESNPVKQDDLKSQLEWHDDMQKIMSVPKSRNEEARTLKNKRIEQLKQLIDIMLVDQTGTPVVTNAMIRNVEAKLKLSSKTIEDTYKDKGYEIQKPGRLSSMDKFFLQPVIAQRIDKNIASLQASRVSSAPWTSKAHNLYDYACFYSKGGDADSKIFRTKKTLDLCNIMEAGAAKYTSDLSDEGHLMADVFSAGATQVFNTEENRRKYDRSLEKKELNEFFLLLKAAPDDFKKDRFFADRCIETIQKKFLDYDLALALYNKEAGLGSDPYEPMEPVIHIVCGSCKAPLEFRSREDAEKAKCSVCGAPLYIECPKCHKKVPSSADRCPDTACNFPISEMQFFGEYLNAAELALKAMDLAEARKQCEKAKMAYPGHSGIAAMETRIETEEKRYKKPLNDLNALIAAGKICEAQNMISKLRASMPKLNLSSQTRVVEEKIELARRRMPASALSDSEKANRCEEILQIVKDYQPAIDMIQRFRPRPPLNVNASTSGTLPLTCTITWNATGDSGVFYRVVRKKNGVPGGLADGEVLADNISVLICQDTTLKSGILYGYAVFAGRRGVYSDPAVCQVSVFSDLDTRQMTAAADNGVCHFSWVLPANCIGVRILRRKNGLPAETPGGDTEVVASSASALFDDRNVRQNVTYGYRLQCIYPCGSGLQFSRGVTRMMMLEPRPEAVTDISSKVSGRRVTVQWTSPASEQKVIIKDIDEGKRNWIGQILASSQINAMTANRTTFADVSSKQKSAEFDIPANSSLSLAVICYSGSRGIISGIVNVSSIEQCKISRRETAVEGNQLKLVLNQPFPSSLQTIYYIVAVKAGMSAPWAKIEEAMNGNMHAVSADTYRREGMILVPNVAKEDLYISVIGQYSFGAGNIIYSEPDCLRINNEPKKSIKYKFIWKTEGILRPRPVAKGCRLIVTSDADEIPEITAVYHTDGSTPFDMTGTEVVVLHRIREQDEGFPGGRYEYSFPDSTWNTVPRGAQIRLFISQKDRAFFEIDPEDVTNCRVP